MEMPGAQNYRAILVDDHAIVFAGLRMVLEQLNFTEIVELSEAVSVIKTIQKKMPDLLVLDIDMPDKEGNLVYESVRRIYPDLNVVIFTKHNSPSMISRLLNSGVNGYINKSTPLSQVEYGIKEIMNGNVFVDNVSASAAYNNLRAGNILEALTNREFEIFSLLVKDFSYQQVADKCNISVKTVGTYRSRIAEKLGVKKNEEMKDIARSQDLL